MSVVPVLRIVIVGGGIAGVSVAEELGRLMPSASVTLLSASDVLKGVRYYRVTATHVVSAGSCGRPNSCFNLGARSESSVPHCEQVTNVVQITGHLEDFDIMER